MDYNYIHINVFFDIPKAFDTSDHNILQIKLGEIAYCGLNGSVLQLLKSHLQNRNQYLEIEQVNSDILPIPIGVSQGYVPGPLLFIIYMKDISQASQLLYFVMYADDSILSTSLISLAKPYSIMKVHRP